MAGWLLAIDFGTSSTAAVVAADGTTEMVEVGGVARIPSAVAALEDESLVAGEAAVRQLALTPERVERAPKRRLGDRAVLLGDRAVSPTALVAAVLRLVADEASRRRGGTAPEVVRLTHPASWASTRLDALRAAARQAGLPEPELLAEPVAAALHLGGTQLATGDHVAVYDLGGGTFDAAVLRRTEDGFVLVGPPGGNDRVGGEDLDEKLLEHVGGSIREHDPESWERLRFSDERSWRRAAAALRLEVRAAKEALSSAAQVTLYVPAPVDREVLVTREELEVLARPDLERTVDELVATVERAGLQVSDLAAVHLVGGASRMPLVGRLIAERTAITPTTWGDPKASVALGAAVASAGVVMTSDEQPTGVLPIPQPLPPESRAPAAAASPPEAPADPRPARRSRRPLVAAAVAAVLLLGGTGALLASGGDDDGKAGDVQVELLSYGFATASDPAIRSERSWQLDAARTTLTSTTLLTSTSPATITRTAVEVVPKEVAARVADVRFDPGFTVVQDDPIVRYEVVLAPAATRTLAWSRTFPTPLDAAALADLAAAHQVAETRAAGLLVRLLPATLRSRAPLVPFADATVADPGPMSSPSAVPSASATSVVAGPGATVPVAPPNPGTATSTTGGGTGVTTGFPPSGSTGVTSGATTSGGTAGTVPTTRPPTTPPRTTTPVPANRAPSLAALANRSSDELAGVTVALSGSDPDGGTLTYSASGLPAGLSVSGSRITGTVSADAASVTTDRRQGLVNRGFVVTVTVRDNKGATAQRAFTLAVRDTHRRMPNYIGNGGCGSGCGSLPDIAAVSTPGFYCNVGDGSVGADTIWRQGVAPGSVISWGQSVSYWYAEPGCTQPAVPKGW